MCVCGEGERELIASKTDGRVCVCVCVGQALMETDEHSTQTTQSE